jgi:hypothetical protein
MTEVRIDGMVDYFNDWNYLYQKTDHEIKLFDINEQPIGYPKSYEDIYFVLALTDEAAKFYNNFVTDVLGFAECPTDGYAGYFHYNNETDTWDVLEGD